MWHLLPVLPLLAITRPPLSFLSPEEGKGSHGIQHISSLAYPREPPDEKEGRTMPVRLQSLATNGPESRSPPKQDPGLSPTPVIEPKDWACSRSPLMLWPWFPPPGSLFLKLTKGKYPRLPPSSLDATPKDEPNRLF